MWQDEGDSVGTDSGRSELTPVRAAEGENMKNLIIINGPMGVGKTSVCTELLPLISPAAFLDGDWCWTMSPFVVNAETRAMVLDNIAHVLNGFLRCSAYRSVLFCWVMQYRSIVDDVLARLAMGGVNFTLITLTASPEVLETRIMADVARRVRSPGVLTRSLERLPLYAGMESVKIDTGALTAGEVARSIAAMIKKVRPVI